MDRISFSGWRDDSGEALAESDVICVPSHAEPYGTVAAEAAARGVPVVATRVGGLREVVVDGAAGPARPGNPQALAAAIAPFLDDPALRARVGAAARERALRAFAPGPYADRVDALLREVVGR